MSSTGIRDTRLGTDIRPLITHVLTSCLVTNPAARIPGPAFRVENAHPNTLRMDGAMGVVYWHFPSDRIGGQSTIHGHFREYSVRIGVKEKCSTSPAMRHEQMDELAAFFGIGASAYTFPPTTINGLTGTSLGSFGIIASRGDVLATIDQSCNCEELEMAVTMRIPFMNLHHIPI